MKLAVFFIFNIIIISVYASETNSITHKPGSHIHNIFENKLKDSISKKCPYGGKGEIITIDHKRSNTREIEFKVSCQLGTKVKLTETIDNEKLEIITQNELSGCPVNEFMNSKTKSIQESCKKYLNVKNLCNKNSTIKNKLNIEKRCNKAAIFETKVPEMIRSLCSSNRKNKLLQSEECQVHEKILRACLKLNNNSEDKDNFDECIKIANEHLKNKDKLVNSTSKDAIETYKDCVINMDPSRVQFVLPYCMEQANLIIGLECRELLTQAHNGQNKLSCNGKSWISNTGDFNNGRTDNYEAGEIVPSRISDPESGSVKY